MTQPLQTHGRHIETWKPPAGDRFVEYEESDRDWVQFFGFGGGGTTRRELVDFYDVRDREENLVGYTDMNPADCRWGYLDLAVMTEEPCIRPTEMVSMSRDCGYELVRVEALPYRMEFWTRGDPREKRHDFLCWVIDIQDAPKLALCDWLKCRGEDNIRQFASDLRRQAHEFERRRVIRGYGI